MYREPVTFQEAEAQLNERMDTPTAMKYTDILLAWDAEARQHAFFSARVAEASILAELHSRVQAVVEGRMTADQARRLIRNYFAGEGADALARLGFAPPRDAHGVAELASIARINLILETNVRFAQETAHYRRWETLRKAYPYGIWRCGVCDEHRPEHLARDGRAYAFEHPIWTQSPPGGEFNCHCTRELCSEKDLERLGLKPEPLGSDFEPSSLGFDPSRGLQPPPPSAKTPPEIAEAAEKAVDRDAQTPNSPANPDSIPNLKPGALPEVPSLPPPPVRPAPRRPDATAYEPRRPIAPEEPAPAPAAPSAEPASPEPATVSAPSAPSGVPAESLGRVSLAALLREKLAKFKEKLAGLWRGKSAKNERYLAQRDVSGTSAVSPDTNVQYEPDYILRDGITENKMPSHSSMQQKVIEAQQTISQVFQIDRMPVNTIHELLPNNELNAAKKQGLGGKCVRSHKKKDTYSIFIRPDSQHPGITDIHETIHALIDSGYITKKHTEAIFKAVQNTDTYRQYEKWMLEKYGKKNENEWVTRALAWYAAAHSPSPQIYEEAFAIWSWDNYDMEVWGEISPIDPEHPRAENHKQSELEAVIMKQIPFRGILKKAKKLIGLTDEEDRQRALEEEKRLEAEAKQRVQAAISPDLWEAMEEELKYKKTSYLQLERMVRGTKCTMQEVAEGFKHNIELRKLWKEHPEKITGRIL